MQDKVDLLVDSEGDFVADESGDLTLATPLETVQQDIIFRGLTAHDDYVDPFLGANLYSFKRRPNTRRNGDFMKAALLESLVKDGRFRRGSVMVDCVPVAKNQVALPVFVRDHILGTEEDLYERVSTPMATVTVDVGTGQISAITGGLR
jgi:hypothetical protein